jgi:holliday junction DNA helicase RuvB
LLACRDAYVAIDQFEIVNANCVDYVLKMRGIDKYGLDDQDRKILEFLREVNRPIGISPICSATDIDKTTIEISIEPWLIKQGFILRTPRGRSISKKGRTALETESKKKGIRLIET